MLRMAKRYLAFTPVSRLSPPASQRRDNTIRLPARNTAPAFSL